MESRDPDGAQWPQRPSRFPSRWGAGCAGAVGDEGVLAELRACGAGRQLGSLRGETEGFPLTYSYIFSSSLCFSFQGLAISHFLPKESNKHIHLGRMSRTCDFMV